MKFALTLVVFLLLFVLFIRLIENKSIFFPSKFPAGYWQPEAFGLTVRDCFFKTADGVRLHGWFVKNDSAAATLIWCTGNAGNISDRLDNLARLAKLPISVFIFGYRGYGKSEGTPDEEGVYQDALAAYDYVATLPEVNSDKIVLFGQSLGGAVAVDLATKRKPAGLILEATFTSAGDMAKLAFGGLPLGMIIKTKFDSVKKVAQVHTPVLVIHGDRDGTVPLQLGRQLFAAANVPKEFYEIAGADHNDTYIVGGQAYFDRISRFIDNSIK